MLSLGRKVGERLMIGDHIILTVLSVQGDRVKLGIEAPKELMIYREEIMEAMKRREQEKGEQP